MITFLGATTKQFDLLLHCYYLDACKFWFMFKLFLLI